MTIDHGYEAGYLTSIVSPPDVSWIEEIRYHPNGLWSEIDHRNNWTERQTIASHGMQRPLALSAENAAGQQQYTTGSFAYDGAGNVKAMGADSFHYDAHNRLAGGTIDGQGYGYTYDAYGNLTSHTRAGTTVSICIDSRKNRMEEPGSSCPYLEAHQSYFGNIETLQTTNYVYDALDMPIHRNPEPVPPDHTYVYTADEERLWFINAGGGPPPGDGGGGVTAWEGLFLRDLDGKLLRQYSKETTTPFTPPDSAYTAPFTVSRDSIHRNGQLAVVRLPDGVIRHQHLDHLGTPRAISAGNGALVSTHKYSPDGKELGGSSGNALQFTGHERDSHGAGEDDNLDYMHARFYSPYVGRFLSLDRADSATAPQPMSWNRYLYALGNPQKYVDPNGGWAFPWKLADFATYNLSRQAWAAASAEFRDSPSWSTGVAAAARFLENAADAAALTLPGVPAFAGVTRRVVLLGETMSTRVQPIAQKLGAVTFEGSAVSTAELLEKEPGVARSACQEGCPDLRCGSRLETQSRQYVLQCRGGVPAE
jgi:RHS repeat-associated protein